MYIYIHECIILHMILYIKGEKRLEDIQRLTTATSKLIAMFYIYIYTYTYTFIFVICIYAYIYTYIYMYI
jgi:hypothetical protein